MERIILLISKILVLTILLSPYCVLADGEMARLKGIENATSEEVARAVGHYARARSLIIAAVREFEKGERFASPAALLDPTEWKTELIAKAKELEKVLAPRARITEGGVKFEGDRRLLNPTLK